MPHRPFQFRPGHVGFAKLQMLGDLKFSETVYGIGGDGAATAQL